MTSYDVGSPLWICLISGMEVPIIAASTLSVSNQLATSQITMPYSPFLTKLPKHTKITLFSFDQTKLTQPKLEFDGVIQAISWRKDKLSGNTGLFIQAQTDGIIWSARKKHNFYIDNGFGIDRMLSMSQDLESHGVTAQNAIFDSISRTIATAKGDGGKAATIFLTHKFNTVSETSKKFDGTLDYVDCGVKFTTSDNKQGTQVEQKNPNYYANYIQKYYDKYKVINKVCRLPLPPKFLDAFKYAQSFGIIMQTLSSLQGEVNFWNYSSYICDQFSFEVYDIPDATSLKLSLDDIKRINPDATEQNQINTILAEYLIKPKSPFGPIPYCNIIFPDQVLDKSFYRNFQAEVTRVSFPQMMMSPSSANTAGLSYYYYQGPHFEKNTESDYFSSYDVHFNPHSPNPNSFLSRSLYEEEFGVNNRQIELSELSTRMFATQRNFQPIQNMVNHQFLEAYTDKISFTLQVKSDVEVVPGMTLLVLDENGEHILAYCYGREKIWDKNGQYIVNLKITYPRAYDIKSKSINDIADPFDPEEYPDTYAADIKMFEKYLGVNIVDPSKDIVAFVHEIMAMWDKYSQNTPEVKTQLNAWRTVASYTQYLEFFGITQTDSFKYDIKNSFNKMPENLINDWDISTSACTISSLQYTYAEKGYLNPQSTKTNPTFKPIYSDLNIPGPIQVSTFISGIVNCHNRFLMQVGNSIT